MPINETIADQAAKVRENQRAVKVNALATEIAEMIKEKIVEEDIIIGDYGALMNATLDKLKDWFNASVNEKRFSSLK